MELKTYPKYMYHVDHNEPIRVDSKAEQVSMENKGWTTARLFKEYPKWVEGKLVQSQAEEERLFGSLAERKSAPDAIGQGPISVEEFPPPIDMTPIIVPPLFEDSQDPEVTKETQVGGQDTAKVVEKPKKTSGRQKKN